MTSTVRPRPSLVAHRGASSVRPENTMAAFEYAVRAGADAIEFDVHATSDGALIVVHDDRFDRTTSGSGPTFSRDLAYVRSLDAGSWFGSAHAGERVPLLDEVLDLADVEFELELKVFEPPLLAAVVSAVERFGAMDRTEFTSSNPCMLLELKRTWPAARIGLFSQRRGTWMTDEIYERAVMAPTPYGAFDVVHAYAATMTSSLVEWIHESDMKAHANDASGSEEIGSAISAGVDRFSTNDVELARSILDSI